ncbi:MAG: endo-1,4-beta-xylanase [Bacteroidales bacterium]|nr:endo-1,4-beta-xylanase [Bacteroidales bacterium]
MKKKHWALGVVLAASLFGTTVNAQLSTNADKFLGNITTRYNVDYNGFTYYKYWNQMTCENESKWGSVEGNNNSFNWPATQINYCKSHNFPFKWHALIWGAQHPSWFNSNMTPEQRYKEIVQWMDAIKKQYPNLELIDVANECVAGHQADTYLFAEALGGGGETGWDWLVKAFELAYERWPNAILIYNDFNTFRWNQSQFIDLVKTLRDAGAPIDAYGNQAHDLNGCSQSEFKSSLNNLNNSLKMPMYITEYDIGTTDDAAQKKYYSEQIPLMWEAEYCAGVTLWGWHYGCTWTNDGKDDNGNDINAGHSGLIMQNKTERPALTWLREYMKTDKAKNAKSPFPGMKKEASVYIKPQARNIEKDKTSNITVRAKMLTKTIDNIKLYAKNVLIGTLTEGNAKGEYVFEYTPTTIGTQELKAVVTCTDGFTWTRYGEVTVANARAPFKTTLPTLPGTIQCEDFDKGADGIAFHDMNSQKQGDASSYRSDATGIDVGNGLSGKVVGYTEVGEWMEYTVNVKEAGLYSFDISYSTPNADATISLALSDGHGTLTPLTSDKVLLAQTSTSGSWSTAKIVHGRMLIPLEEGQQILRLTITGCSSQYVANLDKIQFKKVNYSQAINLAVNPDVTKVMAGGKITCTSTVDVPEGTTVDNVTYYVNGVKNKSVTTAPYTWTYTPTVKGKYNIFAIATDNEGMQSEIQSFDLTVTAKRTPYKTGGCKAPGVIQAEDFDKGEEGFTYHDSDTEYHDKPTKLYRSDSEGVDIVEGNGGYVIGWTASNEWLEYTIDVANTGYYTIEMLYSNGTSTSASVVFAELGDNDKLTTLWTLSGSGTGSWSTYKTKKGSTTSTGKKLLEAGKHIIRVTFKNGNINLDNFTFTLAEDLTSIDDVMVQPQKSSGTYNLSGQKVDGTYRGIVIKNGKKILVR